MKQGQRGRVVECKEGRERSSKNKEGWRVSKKRRLLD
jgi:hypothetical protein